MSKVTPAELIAIADKLNAQGNALDEWGGQNPQIVCAIWDCAAALKTIAGRLKAE